MVTIARHIFCNDYHITSYHIISPIKYFFDIVNNYQRALYGLVAHFIVENSQIFLLSSSLACVSLIIKLKIHDRSRKTHTRSEAEINDHKKIL